MIHVHDLFRHMSERFGERIAVDGGTRSYSYSQLEERANSIANFLADAGVTPDSAVVIVSADSFTVIPAIIGALRAGCIFVPIDPATPQPRLAALLAEVTPALIITEAQYLPLLNDCVDDRPLRVACADDDEPHVAPERLQYVAGYQRYHNPARLSVTRDLDAPCYIYFTSGSTGRPKGIAGRLTAIDHFIDWEINALGVGPGTRVSQLTTPAFDAFLRDMFTPLCAGGTVCVPPTRSTVLDASRLARWLDEQRIELIHCVPSLFRSLLNEPLEPHMFAAFKQIALAGEPLLPADVGRWRAIFGERVQIINLYGPSETTMTKFVYIVQPGDQERRSVPIGKPIDGAKAMVVDSRGKPVPAGAIGEIYIRTPFCSLGYYRQPELTAEVFFRNPFNDDPNDMIYKTGDFGRVLEDGNLELLGRRDHQVKIRGVRIELGEIENVLRSHALVRDVVVVDREETPGHKYLCAYVVLDAPDQIETVRSFATTALPITMIPAVFVPMEALPRTITGKVDRKALPAPAELRARQEQAHVAPRTPIEATLASLWSQALGTPNIGVHDSFFVLGGHSLLATQVLARAYDAFQIEIPLQRLLAQPTIAGLAENIEAALLGARQLQPPPLERVGRDQPLPLSFAQQRLWTLDQLQPNTPAYNIATVIRLSGSLDQAALAHSIQTVVERHETLRTTFPADAPQQCIAATVEIALPIIDLRDLPEEERAAEVQRHSTKEAQQPFDLERGPLLRTTLLRFDDTTHMLLLTMHHIISDAWSVGIFLREIAACYTALCSGSRASLAPLPLQYADFAAWLRRWIEGEHLESQLRYWQTTLADAPPLLQLPTDQPRPAVQSFRGAHLSFTLPSELTVGLRQLSQQQGVTLFMTLLAAFKTLLFRYSGQSDIIIGTPMSNRHRTELEGLIGFFADILALRSDLSGNPSFVTLLSQIRRQTLDAYDHRNIPFEKLVELAGHKRDLSYSPLFQVMFSIEEAASAPLEAAGVQFEPLATESGVAKFDLFLAMALDGDILSGTLEYSTDLFSAASMQQLLTSFETLLKAILADPHTPIGQLTLLSEAERDLALTSAAAARKQMLAEELKKRFAKLRDEQRKA